MTLFYKNTLAQTFVSTLFVYLLVLIFANGARAQCPVIMGVPISEVSCNGFSDGILNVQFTGGQMPFGFFWSTGQNTSTITGLSPGTYTVTVTDVNACSVTAVYTVTEPTAIGLTPAVLSNVNCNGNSDGIASVSATGGIPPYTYQWSNGGISSTVSNLSAGTHTVTVTDDNSCSDSASVTITEPPSLITGLPTNACGSSNNTITTNFIGGTPPYSYLWSNGASTQNVSNLPAGTYTVTVTDANGCQYVEGPHIFTTIIGLSASITEDYCNEGDGVISISASGGSAPYFYTWDNGANTSNISSLSEGTYCITVTDINSCIATSCEVIAIQNPPIMADAGPNIYICEGATTIIGASQVGNFGTPPYTYFWTPTIGINDPTLENPTATYPFADITYVVEVTDINGCVATSSMILHSDELLVSSVDIMPDCGATGLGSISLTATSNVSAVSYFWSNGATTSTNTGLFPGTYGYTVTDDNCLIVSSAVVSSGPCVWPGDTNYDGYANNQDILFIGLKYGETGPVRPNPSLNWVGQECMDWLGTISGGNNLKHIDCDGNGTINDDDTTAISVNYNSPVHPLKTTPTSIVDPPLYFGFSATNVTSNDMLQVDVFYGDSTLQAIDLYGIAWTIGFDPAYVKPGSVSFDFSNSLVGIPSETIDFQKYLPGELQLAIVRNDMTNVSGHGKLGTMHLVIEDNIDGLIDTDMIFDFRNVTVLSNDESLLSYSSQTGSVHVDELSGIVDKEFDGYLNIFPNPADTYLTIDTDHKIERVEVYNTLGQTVLEKRTEPTHTYHLDTKEITPGTYFFYIETDQATLLKKATILR